MEILNRVVFHGQVWEFSHLDLSMEIVHARKFQVYLYSYMVQLEQSLMLRNNMSYHILHLSYRNGFIPFVTTVRWAVTVMTVDDLFQFQIEDQARIIGNIILNCVSLYMNGCG